MGSICSATCRSTARLDGKTAVITGCNTGIGKECTKDFYIRGAKVIMACRSLDKASEAIDDIKVQCKDVPNLGSLQAVKLDLTSLKSVRECADSLLKSEEKIDILLNNAGIMACPLYRTEDGFEMQFGTNHLGHFLFTMLLMPKILASDYNPARIVNVSSTAHTSGEMDFNDLNYNTKNYSAVGAYGQSKLANILFTTELARRLEAADIKNVHTYTLHPGVIHSDLGRHLSDSFNVFITVPFKLYAKVFAKSVVQGAQTSIHCCVAEEAANETAKYYKECAPARYSTNAMKTEDAKRLWEESLILTGLGADFNPFKQQAS